MQNDPSKSSGSVWRKSRLSPPTPPSRLLTSDGRRRKPEGESLLLYKEAASRLGCSTRTISRMVQMKKLKTKPAPVRPKILASSLDAFLLDQDWNEAQED